MLPGILSAGRVVCRACLSRVFLTGGAVLGFFFDSLAECWLGMFLVGLSSDWARGAAFQLELWCLLVKVLLLMMCDPWLLLCLFGNRCV